MITTSVGLTLIVPNLIALAATALLLTSAQVQVRAVEEPYLARVHGTAYTTYAARVGRFLPTTGRLNASATPHHTGAPLRVGTRGAS